MKDIMNQNFVDLVDYFNILKNKENSEKREREEENITEGSFI